MAKKTGTAQADNMVGTAQADEFYGLAGNDVLIGNGGNDYLDGGAGDDDLRGGAGNDVYIVDNSGDIDLKLSDPGIDTVGAFISYTLGANQENLTLIGAAPLKGTGNNLGNLLNGNDGANLLVGLGGNDVLDGRKGMDDLRGGAGNDLYIIDNAGDINKSVIDKGADQVRSIINYTLGDNQESLVLGGTKAIAGGGNGGNNFIQGNDASNLLRGMAGDDILEGGKGNDQLFGSAGSDQLAGGDGNDNLQGDDGNDFLFGNKGIDVLNGAGGNDFLNGGEGRDTLGGGSGDDTYRLDGTLVAGVAIDRATEIAIGSDPGTDTVQVNFDYVLGANQENITLYGSVGHRAQGNDGANVLKGTSRGDELLGLGGADTLDGGAGDDHLVGGDGNDTYVIDNAGDIHVLDVDAGVDTVRSSISYTLLANQENLTLLTSKSQLNGDGNGGDNLIIGNGPGSAASGITGKNVLHGHAGDDQLIGNGGQDSLFGDEGSDILHYQSDALIIDGGAGGSDSLYLVGTAAIVTLDLTVIADTLIKDIEIVRFASDTEAPNQAHVLTLNASDVLAMSSTTDFLQIQGAADDTVNLAGGGWTKDVGLFLNAFQGYTNGSAHVLMSLDASQHEILTVHMT